MALADVRRTLASLDDCTVTGQTDGQVLTWVAATSDWQAKTPTGGTGSGAVTSVSVVIANGLAGTVATATTTPAITLTTTVTGLVKGDGTSLSAAVAGTDYLAPTGDGSGLTGITEPQVAGLTSDLSALTTAVAARLVAASNLSDLANASTARTNLGLGTAATHADTDFVSSTFIRSANTFFAGPATGVPAAPAFRSLVAADLPGAAVQSISLTTPGVLFTTPVNFAVSAGAATGALALNAQAANKVFAGPTTGTAAAPAFRGLVAADVPPLDASILATGTLATSRLPVFVGSGASHAPGAVPDPGPTAGTSRYLREDGGWSVPAGGGSSTIDNSLCCGRLTLTSGTPVTTSDVTAAGTIYWTPYRGNVIALYDGASAWSLLSFAELSISLASGFSSGVNYDVFAYNNSGSVALETVAWANDTTRATAIVLQNGVYCKSGATTRRYLGSFRTVTATTTEDSALNRLVWNLDRQVPRVGVASGTNHTYASSTNRKYNGDDSASVGHVVGLASPLRVWGQARCTNNGNVSFAVGYEQPAGTLVSFNLFYQLQSPDSAGVYGTGYAPAGYLKAVFTEQAFGTSSLDSQQTRSEVWG